MLQNMSPIEYNTLASKSKLLDTLHKELTSKGIKQKEIARRIGLYPSAYSALINKVLPKLMQLPVSQGHTEIVREIFAGVNNISESRLRQSIDQYIEALRLMNEEKVDTIHKDESFIDQLVSESPINILQKLQGVYFCYYLSSFGYRIKKEPLRLYYSSSRERLEVMKGNRLSPAMYQGLAYTSNSRLLTIQLQEKKTLIPDQFICHLHLPPNYTDSLSMLKGISISMSNAGLPISRKLILHKVNDDKLIKEYHQIETRFYTAEDSTDNPIVSYLRQESNYMEYIPIPRPSYDLNDLHIEQTIMELSAKVMEAQKR